MVRAWWFVQGLVRCCMGCQVCLQSSTIPNFGKVSMHYTGTFARFQHQDLARCWPMILHVHQTWALVRHLTGAYSQEG